MLDALTLDQLRVFVCVAESGTFSAAARKLGRVQSAISQSIKSAEGILGLELFARTGRVPSITPAGTALLRDAVGILNDIDALKRRAESLARDDAPQLSLAVDQVFPNDILIESLKSFNEKFPSASVTLFTEGLGASEERLRTNVAKLGIYSPVQAQESNLVLEYLASVRIVPVVATSHPLSLIEGRVSLSEISRYVQLTLTDRAQATRGLVVSANCWMFADQYSRLEYILQGIGWSFAPLHLVQEYIRTGQIKLLDFEMFTGCSFSLPLFAVRLRGVHPDRGTDWFLDHLRSCLFDQRHFFVPPDEEGHAISYPFTMVSTV